MTAIGDDSFLYFKSILAIFGAFLAVAMHGHKFTLTFKIPFIDFDILSSLKN